MEDGEKDESSSEEEYVKKLIHPTTDHLTKHDKQELMELFKDFKRSWRGLLFIN